jgi:hypothetical protein
VKRQNVEHALWHQYDICESIRKLWILEFSGYVSYYGCDEYCIYVKGSYGYSPSNWVAKGVETPAQTAALLGYSAHQEVALGDRQSQSFLGRRQRCQAVIELAPKAWAAPSKQMKPWQVSCKPDLHQE